MQQLSNKAQSYQLDKQALSWGLSVEELMKTAGFKSAEWLLKHFSTCSFDVLCGTGNNGGDGLVTAFYLKKAGREVRVFMPENSQNSLLHKQKKRVLSLNIKIHRLEDYHPELSSKISHKEFEAEESGLSFKVSEGETNSDAVIIDALFGVGLDRPLTGLFKEIVLKINLSQQKVVSLDLPSGLCADTGNILGSSVKAHWTLSFGLAKTGFYFNEGVEQTGDVIVLPIGFPKELRDQVCSSYFLVEKENVREFFPSYKSNANKTDRGHSLIVAGQEGMWGCGLLACRAAYSIGSGYVTWASENYPYKKSLEIPEALLAQIKELSLFDKKTAVGSGPGLGFSKAVQEFYLKLFQLEDKPILLDADALTFLAQNKGILLNKNFVLSPHYGELSRMLKVSSQSIAENPLLYAQQGAEKYKSWLFLKGFHSILSDGEKSWILNSGNSALGKAGSGDVLTGFLTGLMAQGLSPFKACLLGGMIHGETADRWLREKKDKNSFSASAIIEQLAFVMAEMKLPSSF